MLFWAVSLSKHNFSCHRWHVLWVTPVECTYPAHHKIHCTVHPDLWGRLSMLEAPTLRRKVRSSRAGPLASVLSFQAVRLSLGWLLLPIPLGFLEELAGGCRHDSCNRNYWMHVDGAVRACLAARGLPVPFSQTKRSRINTRFVDAPWHDHLGTLQIGRDCSHIQLGTRHEPSATPFLYHATKSCLGPHNFPAFVLCLSSVGSLPWEVWTPKGL